MDAEELFFILKTEIPKAIQTANVQTGSRTSNAISIRRDLHAHLLRFFEWHFKKIDSFLSVDAGRRGRRPLRREQGRTPNRF